MNISHSLLFLLFIIFSHLAYCRTLIRMHSVLFFKKNGQHVESYINKLLNN